MAWYLNYSFVGAGKYITASIPDSTSNTGRPLQIEWEIEFEARKNGTEFIIASTSFNTTSTLLFIRSGTDFELRSPSNANWLVTTGVTLTNFNVFKIRSTFDGTTRVQTLSINGATIATRNPTTAAIGEIAAFFGLNSSSNRHGDFKYFKFTDFVTPANNRLYDANASGGTGNILPETIGGFNGTQVGTWPTDNSEWMFYSTGAITASIALTMPQMSVSVSASKTVPTFSAAIGFTMPQMQVAASASKTVPTFNATIAVTMPQMSVAAVAGVTAPVFASAVNITMPQMSVAATGTVSGAGVAASVSVAMPQMQVVCYAKSIALAAEAGRQFNCFVQSEPNVFSGTVEIGSESVSFALPDIDTYSGSIGDLSRFGCIITTTASNYSGVIQ